ncbi:MAG: helix-turn-helix domain-containing protein [Janthinobacterium lividum]
MQVVLNVPASRLFTIADVADRLKCHPETIRRAIRRGDLVCYRMRGCTRASEEQLATFLQRFIPEAMPATNARQLSDIVDDFRWDRRMQRAIDRQ